MSQNDLVKKINKAKGARKEVMLGTLRTGENKGFFFSE